MISDGGQSALDFDTPQIEPQSPAPAFLSVQERRMLEWLKPRPEPSGEPSGDMCADCQQPILADDDFGLKFGAHASCFGEDH